MDNYNLKLDIEPTKDYEKARKSLIEALNDFKKLDKYEKERLFNEIVAVEMYNMTISEFKSFGNSSIK